MAKIIPDIEKAKLSRQKPEEGEIFLLSYLQANFDPDAEVYFQPCFNGDRPDIVIIKKDVGAIIIEVKDWHLSRYKVDAKNKWSLVSNGQRVKSPAAQVFRYKRNLFEVHANTLLERSNASETFYGLVKVYVYFHNASRALLKDLYESPLNELRDAIADNQSAFRDKRIDYDSYEKQRLYLTAKKKQLERDSGMVAITRDTLNKIGFTGGKTHPGFDAVVYDEFIRLLQPPYHYANQGKPIEYSKLQLRLSGSHEGERIKVCGAAGTGKTAVLAKRAVNAHKRHGEEVLILTFNITLRMIIRDKISEVREGFSWGFVHINNYHGFISAALNAAGHDVIVPPETEDVNEYLEEHYYSNVDIFEGLETNKYKTVLIDEAQDYLPEWQKIIVKYFLAEGGEMVMFADEKQNIYDRGLDGQKRIRTVNGFGRWQVLLKNFRNKLDSPVSRLAHAFRQDYLLDKYASDIYADENEEVYGKTLSLIGVHALAVWSGSELEDVARLIVATVKDKNIHPNDVAILSSRETLVRELDYILRTGGKHQEKTITSFVGKERFDEIQAVVKPGFERREALRKAGVVRKIGFNLNSGVMKLATFHSFKGFESPTVFLFVHEEDSQELIYTALTRAMENVVVFLADNSKYLDFFERHLDRINLDGAEAASVRHLKF